jgi:hypothetical protein
MEIKFELLPKTEGFKGAILKLRKATTSFVMSVCLYVFPSARNKSAPSWRIFIKFDAWVFFEILSEEIRVSTKSDKNKGVLLKTCVYLWHLD